ncbi:MAG: putative DNA binding domain-containing protein [Muribaculum sp.]|nr:putative DNA binding domain-containing protein [Muribaculum sp.]
MAESKISIQNIVDTINAQGESAQIEFKSARGGFPGSFWESYSAFANTDGGTIILGVVEKNNKFFFDGMDEASAIRYKKIFWDCAHNRGKISACLPKESDVRIEKVNDAYILVVYIPRASYDIRPVYISNNPFGNTYRRNHEGDYLCTDAEVRRMFADAEHDRHSQDGRIMAGFNIERDIDMESFHQYRQTFASLQPTHPWVGISDMEFMKKIGAYTTDYETGKEGLTMAGLLMFGNYDSITNNAADPYFFVDYREKVETEDPDVRWTHRIYPDGLWEANLYQFYVKTYNRLIQALPRPFMIKDGVRQEETPAHDAVREALINCIIHEDTTATGNIIVERTDDKLVFRNPGMMLVSKQQYFEGGRSICRNPILQKMFMRLGRAEKAGSGVDKIVSGWQYLGLPTPTVKEEIRPDYVSLTLDLHKTPQENHTRKPYKKTIQENHTRTISKKQGRIKQILDYCRDPKSLSEIMENLGLKSRVNVIDVYINPLIEEGRLAMTMPDNPKNRNQKYVSVAKDD